LAGPSVGLLERRLFNNSASKYEKIAFLRIAGRLSLHHHRPTDGNLGLSQMAIYPRCFFHLGDPLLFHNFLVWGNDDLWLFSLKVSPLPILACLRLRGYWDSPKLFWEVFSDDYDDPLEFIGHIDVRSFFPCFNLISVQAVISSGRARGGLSRGPLKNKNPRLMSGRGIKKNEVEKIQVKLSYHDIVTVLLQLNEVFKNKNPTLIGLGNT
jgi:hypothetical protein